MKAVITSFDAWGGSESNYSEKVLDAIKDAPNIKKIVLPTAYRTSFDILHQAIDAFSPDVVLSIGEAVGREAVTCERVGVNLADSAAGDNAGVTLQGTILVPGAPQTIAATVDYEPLISLLRAGGVPAEYSDDAGRFVCNSLLYLSLNYVTALASPIPYGFVHVPALDSDGIAKVAQAFSAFVNPYFTQRTPQDEGPA